MAKLSTEAVQAALKKLVGGWSLKDGAIGKQYTWPSFPDAIKFVNRVADLAEEADHHPDILINYRRVTLTLSTHSEGGITQKDFDLADRIEKEILKPME
jgi:4a-hydroxytetrahydrobiopterin dehydratase